MVWPLPDSSSRYVPSIRSSRGFSADRGKDDVRHHVGVDLQAKFGDRVLAPETGVVTNIYSWPSRAQPSGRAVMFKSDAGPSFLLAPLDPKRLDVRIGARLMAGHLMGRIGRYPRGSSMLHFEMYEPARKSNLRWYQGRKKPRSILDPTAYLKSASQGAPELGPTTPSIAAPRVATVVFEEPEVIEIPRPQPVERPMVARLEFEPEIIVGQAPPEPPPVIAMQFEPHIIEGRAVQKQRLASATPRRPAPMPSAMPYAIPPRGGPPAPGPVATREIQAQQMPVVPSARTIATRTIQPRPVMVSRAVHPRTAMTAPRLPARVAGSRNRAAPLLLTALALWGWFS